MSDKPWDVFWPIKRLTPEEAEKVWPREPDPAETAIPATTTADPYLPQGVGDYSQLRAVIAGSEAILKGILP